MSQKKLSPVRKSTKSTINQMSPWNGGVEINPGIVPTLDVRFLCAAINYPYMFESPLGDMSIERHWSAAFTLTCMEIDAFLGRDKREFRWRQLDIENGQPQWYWSIGKEYDYQVLVEDLGTNPRVVIAKSPADLKDELRNGVRSLVETGMRRAAFFNRESSHSEAMQ